MNIIIFVVNYKKYIFDLNDFSLHNELVNNHDKIINGKMNGVVRKAINPIAT